MLCRICKSEDVEWFLQLGPTPLANSFLPKGDLERPDDIYPLDLGFCRKCGLVQLSFVVPPEKMFKNYLWVSGTSDTIPKHFQEMAHDIIRLVKPQNGSLVVDIGSNDGTLLKAFKSHSLKVLGIEPAGNISRIAVASGIETINDFFNRKTAETVAASHGKAAVITAANVFAHVDDLEDLLGGIDILLDRDGIFVIEVPYLVDMLQNLEFDTVYHEHLSYFSVKPMVVLFRKFALEIFNLKKVGVHGGSIRVYVKRISSKIPVSDNVSAFIRAEEDLDLGSLDIYLDFAGKVLRLRERLVETLLKLKSQGKKIVGYGAAAKGNTLLNFCRIDTGILDYIADKNSLKHGLFTPGTHIPVYPAEKLMADRPDYVLILAWNFADEILRQQQPYRDAGGKFIIPIPDVEIV